MKVILPNVYSFPTNEVHIFSLKSQDPDWTTDVAPSPYSHHRVLTPPPSSKRSKAGRNHLWPSHIKCMSSSALAPM